MKSSCWYQHDVVVTSVCLKISDSSRKMEHFGFRGSHSRQYLFLVKKKKKKEPVIEIRQPNTVD